ncbi:YihY/virulence factor BrkB family protein [filamentous cyanobacterium CCP1]|nr:YihY/virulence factor BrkB family protein [filamentous cyanobacterium CCP2]PSB54737.1 YihY/virulence factor BrkB family protein [filamentous cyanobacterium CCP1]
MLREGIQEVWQLIKATASEWQFNQVSILASSLAYYTVFSIPPLMIIVIMIVGAIFGEAATQGEIVGQIQDVVGEEAAQVIETAIANLREDPRDDRLRFIFSMGFLAFGASGVFAQIQNALDRIWEVKPEPRRHVFHFLRKRLLSFSMVLVIAFLLIVTFIVNTALATLVNVLSGALPGLFYLWRILSFVISLGILTFLFAAIYAILPDARVAWRDALVGATLTTFLFVLGQFLFWQFLNRTEFGSAYGIAGSFVIIITWIYYAAHILFIGAEFTKVYARRHGSPIVPEEYAVPIHADITDPSVKPASGDSASDAHRD